MANYKSLHDVVNDLDKNKMLLRISKQVDPNLELAEIHRQVFENQGPAIFFENIKGSKFPVLSNLYGTFERTNYLFKDSINQVKKLIELKSDPAKLIKKPFNYLPSLLYAIHALPSRVRFNSPITWGKTTIDQLPQIKSWPMDGGSFITLPQVFSMPPNSKDIMKSNVGMYRIQLSGNNYILNEEIGLHYQLHRGIGNHHSSYNKSDTPFKVSIFVGGLPAHAFSAIMPLPEDISELTFAGLLSKRRFRYTIDKSGYFLSSDADFVITGTILKDIKKPEGPFGDHLGYYSLTHDFPVMKVENVYHRKNPIWHATIVGRPPQEDSSFGYLIHKLVADLTPIEFPGVDKIHAVDAAGVHPLLFATGQERYMPFREKKPEEILTIANRILGSGQTSLAKYLFINTKDDDPNIDIYNVKQFLEHVLERVRWERDLHFYTNTTIDTLDYSGDSWNGGSKLVIASCGPKIRNLGNSSPIATKNTFVQCVISGILLTKFNKFTNYENANTEIEDWIKTLDKSTFTNHPLIIICDDPAFASINVNNFVWVTFTRSNPSHDVYGIDSFVKNKHWGCYGSLIIDARLKPHHAPVLIPDEKIQNSVASWIKI